MAAILARRVDCFCAVPMKRWLLSVALLLTPLSACNCDDTPGGGEDDADTGVDPGSDGASNNDGSSNNDSATNGDGGVGDGALGDGSPLEQTLSDFCLGAGTTVVVVGGGGECAGDLAANTFQFAVCACDSVAVQSTLDLDSFDSNVGAYGGANIADDGNLGINGSLQMDGKLTARGSAYVGAGGFSVGASSRITGLTYASGGAVQDNASTSLEYNAYFGDNVEGRFNIAGDLHVPTTATVSAATLANLGGRLVRGPIPAVRPCPCEASEILDVGALTTWARTHNDNAVEHVVTSTTFEGGGPGTLTLPCGRYYLNRIEQPGSLSIRAEGRTVLFVDGPMHIGGNFGLELAPGAEVDLFVAGDLTVGASARFGDPSAPSKVRTYVGGSGEIVLSASAVFGGMLYAPNANVVFSASSDLYGALFCNSADFNGSASVHFDTAVRTAGRDCVDPPPDGGPGDGGGPDGGDAGGDDASADAGPVDGAAPDSGTGCTGCGECGNQACIIPPGESAGMCAPCTTDLDCCAPQVCQSGVCQFNF